jgi:hypothetical protein
MPKLDGSLILRVASAAACFVFASALAAAEQAPFPGLVGPDILSGAGTPPPALLAEGSHSLSLGGFAPRSGRGRSAPSAPTAPSAPQFFSRYDFHLSAAALASDAPQFSWDTHFGGDLDFVDYVVGRASMAIDYEGVLGHELRAFDPNQGNYTLEARSSVRLRRVETALVLHHVSRHLSDRAKTFPIAWNVLGVRVMGRVAFKSATIDVDAGAGRIVQHSFVDYTWTGDVGAILRHPLTSRVGFFTRGSVEWIGTDKALTQRGTQPGGLAEAGVRLAGNAGALELFFGYERRIDAAPTDRLPERWALAGFRLVR